MRFTLGEAMAKARSDAESAANNHFLGRSISSFVQVQETARKRGFLLLDQVRPWADPSLLITEISNAYIDAYKNMAIFLKSQKKLF